MFPLPIQCFLCWLLGGDTVLNLVELSGFIVQENKGRTKHSSIISTREPKMVIRAGLFVNTLKSTILGTQITPPKAYSNRKHPIAKFKILLHSQLIARGSTE